MKHTRQDIASIAHTLAQTLLEHHRNVCRSYERRTHKTLTDNDVDRCVIRYEVLRSKAGVSYPAVGFGRPLRKVAEWCKRNGWPPLNALVVNQTGRPGTDYSRAPGCGGQWDTDVRRCVVWKYSSKVENW
jgi:hypothetical protein